ncbi:MAG: (R)-stereoselective amidase [bacterium ADurb.Bin429]|nr:MAG: (R)-stereoselective amidase [bacterium ADurb.Bin429]
MRIASYQGRVSFGDVEANLQRVERALADAQAAGAAILCMPEAFVQGVIPDRARAKALAIAVDSADFAAIQQRVASYTPHLLLGFLERDGEKVYLSQAVLERGEILGIYRKVFTATHAVDRGHEFPLFTCKGVTYGVIICADSSAVEPARILAMRGAQLLFTPHYNYIAYADLDDHTRRVRASHIARAIENRLYVVRSNVVIPESQGVAHGEPPGIGLGDSFVVDPRGHFIAEAGLCTETLMVVDLPDDALAAAGLGTFKATFLFPTPEVAETFSEEIRRYARRSQPSR